MVADGTLHADQGENIIFQAEVGMELETVQVAARHFLRLPIDQQQRGVTTKSTDRG